MSEQITLTIPKIDEQLIRETENLKIAALATETEAITALREKYAPLARQNGFIKIAYSCVSTSNSSREDETYYERDGKRVRALKTFDDFGDRNYAGDQNRGEYTGERLYLTQHGEWLKIERGGSWSQWQGEGCRWTCGVSAGDPGEYDDRDEADGSVEVLTDADVAERYELASIIETLSESLKTLSEKLPARMAKVQQRVALASQLLAALKG